MQDENDLPRQQKSKTYKIQEKKDGEWKSVWSVVDFKKTAYDEFDKAVKRSLPIWKDRGPLRLVETLTNEENDEARVMRSEE